MFLRSLVPLVAAVVGSAFMVATAAGQEWDAKALSGWRAEGDAFTKGAYVGNRGPKPRFAGVAEGSSVWWSGRDELQGTLTSAPFKLEAPYLAFQIWGQRHEAGVVGLELLVEGKVVRACSATEVWANPRTLERRGFEVRPWQGKMAQWRINDRSPTGSIAVTDLEPTDVEPIPLVEASQPMRESWRPLYHFTARSGWLNDANGLIHLNGTWHLFHQHKPPGAPATVWGHATSRDLLHWQHQPTAIEAEGRDAIFSGTAALDPQNTLGLPAGAEPPLLLAYTQHPPGNTGRKAVQGLAWSTDGGKTFQKYAGNPILQTRDDNDRDPKLFFHAPTKAWWMVLSLSRNNTMRDQATYGFFRSTDLRQWELRQEVGPGAWFWECPDFLQMPVDGDAAKTKWVLMKGSGDYILGDFDGEKFTPEVGPVRTSYGAQFYGAMTFVNAPGGRTVHLGWVNTTKAAAPAAWPGMPFNQQMSFPRELTLRTTPEGVRMFSEPVREMEQLWVNQRDVADKPLREGENALQGVRQEALDLEFRVAVGSAKKVRLTLRGQLVEYEVARQTLTAFGRKLAWPAPGGVLHVRALLDRTSLELFGNSGAVLHTGTFFAPMPAQGHELSVEGGEAQLQQLRVCTVKGIW